MAVDPLSPGCDICFYSPGTKDPTKQHSNVQSVTDGDKIPEQWTMNSKRKEVKISDSDFSGHCISPTPGTYFTPKHDPTSAGEGEETESKEV